MKVSYQFDQDPRYGWASIETERGKSCLIVVHDETGSHGFDYADGKMTPACICNAWTESECVCPGVVWADENETS